MPASFFTDIEKCADWIIQTTGPDIRLALPLGLGKANRLANAIYGRVAADPDLRLSIVTALTLEIPQPGSELEKRFLDPLARRIFHDYPELLYAVDRRNGCLPDNVEVYEFYMSPGDLLDNSHAQQRYISSNYTHVTRDLIDRGVNVVAQLIAGESPANGQPRFSLSCNPDLTLDVAARQRTAGRPILVVGEVNENLPFMYGDAVVKPDFFDAVVETPAPHSGLFGTPKTPVATVDYMIGLHASTLVRDGGTLQIGIGSLGDALVSALKLRHEDNRLYRSLLEASGILHRFREPIERVGGLEPFEEGLYGATEMLVDGFLHLYRSGILKRRVYDDRTIQRLLNEKRIDETVSIRTLKELAGAGAIRDVLTPRDVAFLKKWGILKPEVSIEDGDLVTPGGGRLVPDMGDRAFLEQLEAECLGGRLAGGVVASAGFFLGPRDFYDVLRRMPRDERALINMTSVLSVNHLYGNVELDTLQRKDARFINSCLMATLTGAVVSDGLESQRVLSGVGGQFNFVTMAHALPDGRSIIALRSTRDSGGGATSNIRFSYGHTTIPRHLRDFVVTEYGIADLRGTSDAEAAAAMLNVTDSRFQGRLLDQAKRASKLPQDYQIPHEYRNNLPETLGGRLAGARARGWFAVFPFGSDYTDVEKQLGRALKELRKRSSSLPGKTQALMAAARAKPEAFPEALARLDLSNPRNWREKLYARLVAGELGRGA